jgi:FtsP/CotA-like multicopper oxidase with cupredoxin domain
MTRRLLAGIGGLGAGAALVGVGGFAYGGRGTRQAAPTEPAAPLRDLPEVRSRGGLLEHTLTIAPARPVVGGRRLHLGKTVYHCRILPHEDNGMMGNLFINQPGTPGRPSHTSPGAA